MKNPTTLLKTGIIGSVIAALCCFTPILVVLLGAVGLSSIVGYLDFVLLPALALFVCITIYAMARKSKS
jgi:mercuric ion transport protein